MKCIAVVNTHEIRVRYRAGYGGARNAVFYGINPRPYK